MSPFAGMSQAGQLNASGGVQAFEFFFHRLTEPSFRPAHRSAFSGTAAEQFSAAGFLYQVPDLSGGRDKQPGVFLYADADMRRLGNAAAPYLIANENNAMPFALDLFGRWPSSPTRRDSRGPRPYPAMRVYSNASSGDPTHPSSYDLQEAAKDDISNHNLQAVSAIGGSG